MTTAAVTSLPDPSKTPKALAMSKPPQVDAPSFKTQNDSVADHMDGLMSQDSRYMKLARTAGLSAANNRGLLNSSMAVGEAQDAAARAALPIASQDAAQAFEKNFSHQNFGQERVLQRDRTDSAEFLQGRDISSAHELAGEERGMRERMQDKEIGSREMLALADIAAAKERLGMQLSSSERMALEERTMRREMQQADIASSQYMQEQDIAYRERAQDADIAANSAERALDRKLQEQLASWELSSSDRNAAAQLLSNMEATYAENYRSIMANTNLDATTRAQQLQSAMNLRNAQISFVEQMYSIDLQW